LPPTLLQTDESHETEQQQVIVPVTNITLNEIELIELENTINPLRSTPICTYCEAESGKQLVTS
jgi:hypothetical protein